jgi:hypothetical protein
MWRSEVCGHGGKIMSILLKVGESMKIKASNVCVLTQVLRSILPQLSQTKPLHDNQAVNQQQKSDSLAFLR